MTKAITDKHLETGVVYMARWEQELQDVDTKLRLLWEMFDDDFLYYDREEHSVPKYWEDREDEFKKLKEWFFRLDAEEMLAMFTAVKGRYPRWDSVKEFKYYLEPNNMENLRDNFFGCFEDHEEVIKNYLIMKDASGVCLVDGELPEICKYVDYDAWAKRLFHPLNGDFVWEECETLGCNVYCWFG